MSLQIVVRRYFSCWTSRFISNRIQTFAIAFGLTAGEKLLLEKSYKPNAVELKGYGFWERQGFVQADTASPKRLFRIVVLPPNVTGPLHMGHALQNTLHDIPVSWKKINGFSTLGLPRTGHSIADALVARECGMGAATATPAHDPNDKDARIRDRLPRIPVIDYSENGSKTRSLARLDTLGFAQPIPGRLRHGVSKLSEFDLDVQGTLHIESEEDRRRQEMTHVKEAIDKVWKKAKSPHFLSRVPEEVVLETGARHSELPAQRHKLELNLSQLPLQQTCLD